MRRRQPESGTPPKTEDTTLKKCNSMPRNTYFFVCRPFSFLLGVSFCTYMVMTFHFLFSLPLYQKKNSVCLQMIGNGRNIGSPSSIPNNYAAATRRGMNGNGMGPGQAHGVSPTYPSPHSVTPFSPQMDYRSLPNGGASMGGEFPSAPYTPISNFFMSQELQSTLTNSHQFRQRRPITSVSSSKFAMYTTIYNMEDKPRPMQLFPQVRAQAYQTTSRFTGKDIFLRRLASVPIPQENCESILSTLRQYRHPNLVTLTDITATEEFVMGSNDVLMAYRYINGAKSLEEAFFGKDCRATEGLLWSFTCQLVSLLRSFHETMVPVRGIHVSKIIYVESTGRFYFTALGLADLVDPKPSMPCNQWVRYMREDIHALGLILFQLATQQIKATADQFNGRQIPGFSLSFCELIKTCLESNTNSAQLCRALGERMSMEVGHQEGHSDYLMLQCSEEMHNGRMMKLLIKLNFAMEVQSNFFGEQRFTLRLFNQFLFNQVDEHNTTHVDWGHVYHCLNKLDCGSDEVIQLMAPNDHSTVLVVSYADLRQILESVFDQMKQNTPSGIEVENPAYQ
ncbi:PAB-dependent poly(A)-specific ribonuclease subunit 3 [Angomonas deanei]|nr:PAB-dependent poly(A)-specific ribonuclease subunit 3 [Angomonas deanei]|eukprot:EPY31697.1 PAB-dependent poly(A)-specific ribonuclease subunit 3 [Angomonas deanei]